MPRDQFEAFGGATESTWSDIGSVVITLVARPRTEAKTNIDLFRGEGSPSLYSADWRIRDPQIIGMLPSAQGTVLLFRNVAGSFSAMSKVGDAKDFVLTAELTPLTPGRGGLFLRGNSVSSKGLSFVIGGIGSSTWQMMRTDDTGTTTIKEGSIENLTFRDDATYWLRATVKASWMTLAMSRDGKTFTTIGSIRDVTFPFGEVGLSAFDSAAYVVRKIDYQRL